MSPYRNIPQEVDGDQRDARWDDGVLGGLMILIGGVRVVIAIAGSEHFGAEATVSLITACLGILILAWRR